jgi:DnaJ-domain-containing protein 1
MDKKLIVTKCKDYQKKYHPDKHTLKDHQSQTYANEFSAYVNEGKEVLLNDLKRMTYLVHI